MFRTASTAISARNRSITFTKEFRFYLKRLAAWMPVQAVGGRSQTLAFALAFSTSIWRWLQGCGR